MRQDEAKLELLRLWSQLPKAERSTECQAADFAMKHRNHLVFRCSGDRYQLMKGWLLRRLSKPA